MRYNKDIRDCKIRIKNLSRKESRKYIKAMQYPNSDKKRHRILFERTAILQELKLTRIKLARLRNRIYYIDVIEYVVRDIPLYAALKKSKVSMKNFDKEEFVSVLFKQRQDWFWKFMEKHSRYCYDENDLGIYDCVKRLYDIYDLWTWNAHVSGAYKTAEVKVPF